MRNLKPHSASREANDDVRSFLLWVLAAGCLLLVIVGVSRPRRGVTPSAPEPAPAAAQPTDPASTHSARDRLFARLPPRLSRLDPAATPQVVVSNKVAQFGRSRRDIAHALARKHNVPVPADLERFFDAIDGGRWEEVEASFKGLQKLRTSDSQPEGFLKLWPTVVETFGCAEAAHDWPAQKLLDYGDAVLGALRPGMAYVGGTDAGRFIPTLLNETSDGERHIVVTQNAFADASYLDYLGFLHGDKMVTLTQDDSQRAFSEYLADAQKRLAHDRDFPGDPKQLRPGEDVRVIENRVQVSGQVAVMSINERLLQTMMARNPDLAFALEESYPLRATYGGAAPLGPILELGAQDSPSVLTAERAAQSVDYWRAAARELMTDPEASGSPETLKSYSKLATAQANLFGDRDYSTEAEQAYRLASEIWPGNVEAVSGLCALLDRGGRPDEARKLVEDFGRRHPEMRADLERGRAMWQFTRTTPARP